MNIDRRLTRLEARRPDARFCLEVWRADDTAHGRYIGPDGRAATRADLAAAGRAPGVVRLFVHVIDDLAPAAG